MQDASNSKQLIAEKMKQSANILVTVSANPSVDSLTAALGLTLMLNKLDKHATAVFSGVIPPAISFLEPNKTFENNVDSLRDFIIALDKDKADRLRYKVEDDVVRIFITPYRTKISEKDLQFSQGDFNVDLIVALGVEDQKDLDQAITAHGRILHDATVVTINAASQKSSLGSIDWQDGHASSLSEMLASIAEMLKQSILDQQISTALLTGIVAATERFSNQKTTPRVMTIAAQLMAAGANQQLIATKLQTIPTPVSPRKEKPKQPQQDTSTKIKPDEDRESDGTDGEMHINHGRPEPPVPIPVTPEPVEPPKEEPAPTPTPEPESLEPELPIAPPPAQNFDELKQAIQEETVRNAPHREMVAEPPTPGSHNINAEDGDEEDRPKADQEDSYLTTHPSWQGREIQPPSMGGTLNATAEQALEDKMREEQEQKRNRTILTHGDQEAPAQLRPPKKKPNAPSAPKQTVSTPPPPPASVEPPVMTPPPQPEPEPQPIAPAPVVAPAPTPPPQTEVPVAPPPLVVSEPIAPAESIPAPILPPEMSPMAPASAPQPTLEELQREAANHAAQAVAPQSLGELEAARQQVNAALPPLPGMPQPATTNAPIAPQPAATGMDGLPPLPPMPDFGTLPPVPGSAPAPELPQLPQDAPLSPPQPTPNQQPPAPVDPGQFRIPGQ